jgi:kynurenine formamidase
VEIPEANQAHHNEHTNSYQDALAIATASAVYANIWNVFIHVGTHVDRRENVSFCTHWSHNKDKGQLTSI